MIWTLQTSANEPFWILLLIVFFSVLKSSIKLLQKTAESCAVVSLYDDIDKLFS